jgi:alpha-tubulin suppressor-like RCC1 family protein
MSLLIIQSSLPELDLIIASITNTQYVLFNEKTDSLEDILNRIKNLQTVYSNIGIMWDNKQEPNFQLVEKTNPCLLANVKHIDSNLISWQNLFDFLVNLTEYSSVRQIDFISCHILSDPNWKYIIDQLKIKKNLIINSSSQLTGSVGYADWTQESNQTNLIGQYFNEKIHDWKHNLGGSGNTGSTTFVMDLCGHLYGCGNNNYGQLGLTAENTNILVSMILNGKSIKTVACNRFHTIVLDNSGYVYGCGSNYYGQLGIGTTSNTNVLVQMISGESLHGDQYGINNISSIACGEYHTVLLDQSGYVFTCGSNNYGQLGLGQITDTSKNYPVLMASGNAFDGYINNVLSIACGQYHTIISDGSGYVYGCGNNKYGQLGIGDNTILTETSLAQMLSGNAIHYDQYGVTNISKVACGQNHSIVLDNSGYVFSCGLNTDGQLGNGTNTDSAILKQMLSGDALHYDQYGVTNIMAGSCGSNFTVLLDQSGYVYGCGDNNFGQLGNISNNLPNYLVQMLSGNAIHGDEYGVTNIAAISCGQYHTILLDNSGYVYATGLNTYGQLGDNIKENQTGNLIIVPRGDSIHYDLCGNVTNIVSIACGGLFSVLVDNSGYVYDCGNNNSGQLGIGSYAVIDLSRNMLSQVKNGNNTLFDNYGLYYVSSVSCGKTHTVILDAYGSVYSCGSNAYGQLGDGTTTNKSYLVKLLSGDNIFAVSCGDYHTILLDQSGYVYGCGSNAEGQLGIDSYNGFTSNLIQMVSGNAIHYDQYGVNNILVISCGQNFTVLLDQSGYVYGCGSNTMGQIGNGSSSNQFFSLVPFNQGNAKYGELNGIQNIVKNIGMVSCGRYHTMLLDDTGYVYGCGSNSFGQLGIGLLDTSKNTLVQMVGGAALSADVSGVYNIGSVACGAYHTILLDQSGYVYGCGYNNYGQLGDGTNNDSNTLVQMISGNAFFGDVYGVKNINDITCGAYHTVLLDQSGFLYACGLNDNGQLGDMSNSNVNTLVNVLAGDSFFTDPLYSYGNLLLMDSQKIFTTYTPILQEISNNIICFGENTKVLCLNANYFEEFIPIEKIRPGTLVKTYKNGYKPVNYIGFSTIDNPETHERIKDRLYVCSKLNYPELDEDLILTGCHSLLVDYISVKQQQQIIEEFGKIYMTEDKLRLMAFIDDNTVPYLAKGEQRIWHFSLSHDNPFMNYGVYVNGNINSSRNKGLLVETTSKRFMIESKMTLLDSSTINEW